jgi:hypothetical protein
LRHVFLKKLLLRQIINFKRSIVLKIVMRVRHWNIIFLVRRRNLFNSLMRRWFIILVIRWFLICSFIHFLLNIVDIVAVNVNICINIKLSSLALKYILIVSLNQLTLLPWSLLAPKDYSLCLRIQTVVIVEILDAC